MAEEKEVPSDKYFYAADSTVLKDLSDLKRFLSSCKEETFNVHVNPEKNDFANWARDVFQDKKLAERINSAKNAKEMLYAMEDYDREKHIGNYKAPERKKIVKQSEALKEAIVVKSTKSVEEIKKAGNFELGIPGFSELVPKGIPRNVSVLVGGGPGSGKTTFCLHLAYSLALQGERCLYLSFEESEERLKEHMRSYGWNIDELEKKGNLAISRKDPFVISRSVEALLAEARGELLIEIDKLKDLIPEGKKPTVLVLDSLSAVSAAFSGKDEGYRIYIEQLFRALESAGVTSFLITEVDQSSTKFSESGVEEFLADGVIALYNVVKSGARIGAIEVVKLRGVGHKKRIVPIDIVDGQGFVIYPHENIFVEDFRNKPA